MDPNVVSEKFFLCFSPPDGELLHFISNWHPTDSDWSATKEVGQRWMVVVISVEVRTFENFQGFSFRKQTNF